jgi:hypothetical protein
VASELEFFYENILGAGLRLSSLPVFCLPGLSKLGLAVPYRVPAGLGVHTFQEEKILLFFKVPK